MTGHFAVIFDPFPGSAPATGAAAGAHAEWIQAGCNAPLPRREVIAGVQPDGVRMPPGNRINPCSNLAIRYR